MKKIVFLLAALALCLTLCACSVDEPNGGVGDDGPISGDDNSMFEYPSDPRKFVVDYIREMSMIKWTPKESFTLYGKFEGWSYSVTYEKGATYFGPPFLVDSRATLQQFADSVKDGVYVGGTSSADCLGSACYDAVYVTLIQVCPSISFESTADMLPKNNTGLIQVGEWDASPSKQDTPTILAANSIEKMAKAYAQLKPGDVVLKHIVSKDAGHARIVSGGPVIYYNDDGSVDCEKSYITASEQTNAWNKETTRNTTWWIDDHTYTFKDLYTTYFVPLSPVDYTVEMPDPYVNALNVSTGDAKKISGKLKSNQYIVKVTAEIENSSGKVVYAAAEYPNAKTFDLADMKYSPKLIQYSSGKYTLKLKAALAFGEKTFATYDFEIE